MALTCLDIITDAMKELRVLPSGGTPRAPEAADGMLRLQAIVNGLFGFGIGTPLSDQDISQDTDLSADTRALVNAASPITLTFPEAPSNGQRIQIIDVGGTLATYPLTLDGNGRMIESAATQSLNTNGLVRTWVYIGETGNWARTQTLAQTDTLALGDDEFFTLELAKRLAPMFGAQMSQESIAALTRAANRIRARFRSTAVTPCDNAVLFLSRQSYNPGWLR